MPGFNLVRNAKVFFTSDVTSSTGVVNTGALTSGGTQELSVMNGFSFSQNVDAQVITVAEAGNTPARGQRSFNTALQPVDFSFTTYMRPKLASASNVAADELVLWNAMFAPGKMNVSPSGVGTAGETGFTTTSITRSSNTNVVTFAFSSLNLSSYAIGDRVNLAGAMDTTSAGWVGSGTIQSIGGASFTTATNLAVVYDVAPLGSGNPNPQAAALVMSKNSAALRSTTTVAGKTGGMVSVLTGLSNKNQLQKFGMVIIIDQATYVIDNCVLDQAQIDFGLDAIAQIQWSGKGTALRVLGSASASAGTFGSGALTGSYTAASANTSGAFLTNKLSTAVLKSTLLGSGTSAKTYTVALTGGSLTIANNVSYVTPETLGVVNQPIGYFTGTRAVSGSVNAYLKTGAGNTTNTLLNDILSANSTETKYYLEIDVGGASNANRVELEMPSVSLQVPTVEVQDVVASTINFTAQDATITSSATADLVDNSKSYFDLEAANGLTVRYFSDVT